MASDPSLQLATISEAMRGLFASMSASDALPEFLQISNPKVRSESAQAVAQGIADRYQEVYQAVERRESGYAGQGGSKMIKHTPAQMRTILGVVNVR